MKTKLQVTLFLFLLLFVQQADTQQNHCPDLIIQSISMSPTNPATSDNIKFKVMVKNIGNAAAGPSVLGIRVGGETNPKTYNIPGLAPNASRTVIRSQRLSVAQNYRTTAYADHTGKLNECNERNNTKYINFKVTKGCPDLIIRSITMSPTNPTISDNIKFKVTVKNIGNATAGPSVLGIRVGGETNPKTYNIPGLAPNASRTVIRSQRLSVTQNYRTTAYADHTKRIPECNERNNIKFINFRVTAGQTPGSSQGSNTGSGQDQNTPPSDNTQNQSIKKCYDLKIDSITWKPYSPQYTGKKKDTNKKMMFTIKVKNTGTGKSPSCHVMLFIGKYLVPINNFPPMDPGSSKKKYKSVRIRTIVRKNYNKFERRDDPFRDHFKISVSANIMPLVPISGCPPSSHINHKWVGSLKILKK